MARGFRSVSLLIILVSILPFLRFSNRAFLSVSLPHNCPETCYTFPVSLKGTCGHVIKFGQRDVSRSDVYYLYKDEAACPDFFFPTNWGNGSDWNNHFSGNRDAERDSAQHWFLYVIWNRGCPVALDCYIRKNERPIICKLLYFGVPLLQQLYLY